MPDPLDQLFDSTHGHDPTLDALFADTHEKSLAAPPGAAPDADPADAARMGYNPMFGPGSTAAIASARIPEIRKEGLLPPPPEPDRGFWGGAWKGLLSTGTNIGEGIKGAATGDFGPYDEPGVQSELEQGQASVVPQTGAEKTGYYTEKVGELLAPGGIVRRGASGLVAGADFVAPSGRVLAELPGVISDTRLGRAAALGLSEGLSNAGVTLAQTGDPESAGWAGLVSGLTAGPLKYFSKPERVAALVSGAIDPALAKSSAEAGTIIQARIADARKAAGLSLGSEYARISDAADKAGVKVRVDQSLPRIKELLAELKDPTKHYPALGGTDSVNRAISVLEDFVKTHDTVPVAGLVDASGNPIVQKVARETSVEDALKIRTLLRDLGNSGQIDVGKGALKQLTQEWHREIETALNQVDPTLAQSFNKSSTQYAQFIKTYNNALIKTMIRKGAPEQVLNVLKGSGAETTAKNLQELIGPQNMEMVRASLWKDLLNRSVEGATSTFSAKTLNDALREYTPEAQRAVFGSVENVNKLRRFAELADNSWIARANRTPLVGSMVQPGVLPRMAIGAAAGAGVSRVLDRSEDGGWHVGGAAGAAIALSPVVLAKVLAKPGAVDVLTKALQTSSTGAAGRALTSKLMSLVMGATLTMNKREQSAANPNNGVPSVLDTLSSSVQRARRTPTFDLSTGPPAPTSVPSD